MSAGDLLVRVAVSTSPVSVTLDAVYSDLTPPSKIEEGVRGNCLLQIMYVNCNTFGWENREGLDSRCVPRDVWCMPPRHRGTALLSLDGSHGMKRCEHIKVVIS